MFVGREKELAFLEERYQRKEGQLIVLYGRRRVGKTETLRKFCEGKQHVFYSCVECPDEQQLKNFSARMLKNSNPAAKYLSYFSDWRQLFENIGELCEYHKQLIIIDEFPYMVKNNPAIPSILQNVWDSVLKNKNVCIILCGSAMSFIEKEILSEKNPLYGRATGILKMTAMDFYDAVQFLPHFSCEDRVSAYAILGGIPHYLLQFDDGVSLEENVVEHILQRGSILYSEVEFLLRQELRETSTYNAIIQAITLGNTKLNDIHQKTQIDKTKISAYLKNLMDLGIVYREFPVSAKPKEMANVSRGLYELADQYFFFWYSFVFQNRSELEAGDAEGIWKYAVEPELDLFVSRVFEIICIQYLRKKNQHGDLPFHFVKIGRWWDKENEIDIMAVDRTCKNVILGECKYKKSKMGVSDLRHLQAKFAADKKKDTFYYLFSRSGFSEQLKKVAGEESVYLVGLQELVSL